MADLEALEAALEAESDEELTYDTSGSSAEIIRRVGAMRKAFLAGTLAGFPTGSYELFVSDAKRETTVLLNRGLRLRKRTENTLYFHCALDGCWMGTPDEEGNLVGSRCEIKYCLKATSNVTAHLKTLHAIESTKTKVGKTKGKRARLEIERHEAAHSRDPVAFTANALTLWATEHSIPISAFRSPYFQQIMHRIPGCDRNTMERQRCRMILLQQYLTVKRRIKNELASAKIFFGEMPFVSVNLDLYQDPRQNKKYIAIRISWVDGVSGKLVSRLIAARHYNPTYQEKSETQASALLAKWYKSIVESEYRITEDMVLGGTGDHGSDVKKVMKEHCGTHGFQEWCISHMLNVVFKDAYGVCNDKEATKNPEARAVLDRMRKAIESLTKSTYLRKFFEERQEERNKNRNGGNESSVRKVTNPPPHRWGSTETTFDGVLSNWEDLGRSFRKAGKGAAWQGMEEVKVVLEEFHSVLRPFRVVQITSQSGSKFNLLDALLLLFDAYAKISKGNGNTVTMLWPRPVRTRTLGTASASAPPVKKSSDQLDHRTRLVIQKLRAALDTRYFNRFHPIHSLNRARDLSLLTEANVELSKFRYSYLFEIALLFNPQLYKGDFIDTSCQCIEITDSDLTVPGLPMSFALSVEELRSRHARLIKAALWKKIRELALIAGKDMAFARRVELSQVSSPSQSPVPASPILPSQDTLVGSRSPPRKRRSRASLLGWGSPDCGGSQSTVGSPQDSSVSEIVDEEIQKYKTLGRWWAHDRRERELVDCTGIEWWCRWGPKYFPCLSKVALAIFGVLPGSGALECDIGGFKDILGPKRARMDPAAVEMHLVVDKNKDLTELDPRKLEQLPKRSWERLYPTRPASPVDYYEDEELELEEEATGVSASYDFDPNPAL
jgi:hypothetical protein